MHPNILLHGSKDQLPDGFHLRAGSIELTYMSGFLRYLSCGPVEVLRMINYYIRDENWNTIPMTIMAEKIETDASGFSISYTARCRQGDVDFQWSCEIVGKADSTVTFEIEGEALSTFKRNRLGLTVLHPIETCTGKPCTILHPDNSSTVVPFPDLISPHQPFFNIAGMQWIPATGVTARVDFDGDVFETEDQRNWIDASYKTYCTPLERPFPVTLEKGDKIRQRVQLSVRTDVPVSSGVTRRVAFSLDRTHTTPFPQIGIPAGSLPLDGPAWQRIHDLSIDFLRVVVWDSHPDMGHVMDTLRDSSLPLEVVIFFDAAGQGRIIEALLPYRDRIRQFIVLPSYAKCTDEDLISRVVPGLRRAFPQAVVGGGTDAFFTELNRDRTPGEGLDFLSFSINPQVHASDVASMVENLASQADVIRSCRAFASGCAIHVGPVTLRMRKNPDATATVALAQGGRLPEGVDPRQMSLFCAAWTLGSFKYLAESGVGAITFYEVCGWRGLFPHPGEPWPADFQFPEGGVYPIYIVLQTLLERKTSRIGKLVSNSPLVSDGLLLVDEDGKETVMLANYTRHEQMVQLPPEFKVSRYWTMEDANAVGRIARPSDVKWRTLPFANEVLLAPFGVAVLE